MDGSTATPTADTGSTTTGPATFSDQSLSWADDSSASTPASDASAAPASADATDPPASSDTPDGTTPATGEPPKERWTDILANARAKEREAALGEWRQKHGWAEQVDQQEFAQIQRIARAVHNGDRIAGLQELIAEIRKDDPGFDAQLRSFAARTLAQRNATQATPTDLDPINVGTLPNGQPFMAYSAEQVQAIVDRAVAGVRQEFDPVVKTHEQLQAERVAIQQQQAITTFAAKTMDTASKWKGMNDPDFRRRVAERLSLARVDGGDSRDVSLAFRDAYLEVRDMEDQTLTQKAEARTLDTLQRKAAASTSVNPGSAAPSTPKAVRSFHDLPPDAWR